MSKSLRHNYPQDVLPIQLELRVYSNLNHPKNDDHPVHFEEQQPSAQNFKHKPKGFDEEHYLHSISQKERRHRTFIELSPAYHQQLAILFSTAVYEPGYEDYCKNVRKLFPESLDDFDDVCANI